MCQVARLGLPGCCQVADTSPGSGVQALQVLQKHAKRGMPAGTRVFRAGLAGVAKACQMRNTSRHTQYIPSFPVCLLGFLILHAFATPARPARNTRVPAGTPRFACFCSTCKAFTPLLVEILKGLAKTGVLPRQARTCTNIQKHAKTCKNMKQHERHTQTYNNI